MKKRINFKKAATTFMLVLSLLCVPAGKPPITEPVPGEEVPGKPVDEETEPGIQPLSDKDKEDVVTE